LEKMKSSTIAIILSFTASSIAAPYARFGNTMAKRDAVADCGTNQACVTVAQAIEGWVQSANTVNQFLNDPTLDPQVALNAANAEPGFLGTLSTTAGLDSAGTAAAQTLTTFFPGIPALLNIAVAGEGNFAGDAVNGINDLRPLHCSQTNCTILVAAVPLFALTLEFGVAAEVAAEVIVGVANAG
jgi:hypothetical protein